MATIKLSAQPSTTLQQVDAIGFKDVEFDSQNAPQVNPGDKYYITALGGVPNRSEIGFCLPGGALTSPADTGWPMATDGAGNIVYQGTYNGPATIHITDAPGLLIAAGVLPGGRENPFGYRVCSYYPPQPTLTPGAGSFAKLIADVENSFNTGVPVVDGLSPQSWTAATYLSKTPFAPQAVPVGLPIFPGGVAASQSAANTIANELGGTIVMQVPTPADYGAFYTDPGAVAGSLAQVPYVTAQVPIGTGGTLVKGIALVGNVISAVFYGRQTGLSQMVLATFKEVE